MADSDRVMVHAGQSFHQPEVDHVRFFSDLQEAERMQVSREEMTWVQKYVRPERPAEVVLNLSCGVQSDPHVMMGQVALFRALGVDFVATAGTQFCCGRAFQRSSKEQIGDRMAATSIARFASWQPATNVQCCGSCFVEFDHHVGKLREVGRAPFEVVHITRFVRERLERFGEAVPWTDTSPLRVLLHAEGIEMHPTKEAQRLDVIATLGMVPGVEFAGMVRSPALGMPCKTISAGVSELNDLTPEQYREVQDDLYEQARAAGASAIVTHHHLCHREWSKFGSERLPILQYQAMMAERLGHRVPDRFQILWRLGDPDRVVEETRPHWESWGIAEQEARRMAHRHFNPKYAAAVVRCPCEQGCFLATHGPRAGTGAVCSQHPMSA